jgi:prepilin-type N-terminal cleavage/methylation domain-containing protein
MISKLKKSNKEGFTIIEVMIVLAIAGLILLIVFLAVPALQRNTRNTDRKSGTARLSSAVSNFVSNSNGAVPATAADMTSIQNDAGTLPSELRGLTAGIGAMAPGHFNVETNKALAAPTIAISGVAPTDAVELDTGAACGVGGATVLGSSVRSMAMLYTIEPGSGANYTILCIDI